MSQANDLGLAHSQNATPPNADPAGGVPPATMAHLAALQAAGLLGSDVLQAQALNPFAFLPPVRLPPPQPLPGPFPLPTAQVSLLPNQLSTGPNNVTLYASGVSLPLTPIAYTVVNAQGVPVLGTGIQVLGGSPMSVALIVFLSPGTPPGSYSLRVQTNVGVFAAPFVLGGTSAAPRIDYLSPSLIYVYSAPASFDVAVGGANLTNLRLENAPTGVSASVVFSGGTSAVLRVTIDASLPSNPFALYNVDVVAGTAPNVARATLQILKF